MIILPNLKQRFVTSIISAEASSLQVCFYVVSRSQKANYCINKALAAFEIRISYGHKCTTPLYFYHSRIIY